MSWHPMVRSVVHVCILMQAIHDVMLARSNGLSIQFRSSERMRFNCISISRLVE